MGIYRWGEGWQEFAGNIEVFRMVKVEETSKELVKGQNTEQDKTGHRRRDGHHWLSDGL